MKDDMGPLPEVHPRQANMDAADLALREFLIDWHDQYDLTSAEYAAILSGAVTNLAARLVAIERRKPPEGNAARPQSPPDPRPRTNPQPDRRPYGGGSNDR